MAPACVLFKFSEMETLCVVSRHAPTHSRKLARWEARITEVSASGVGMKQELSLALKLISWLFSMRLWIQLTIHRQTLPALQATGLGHRERGNPIMNL